MTVRTPKVKPEVEPVTEDVAAPVKPTKQGRRCVVCGGVFSSAQCPTDGQPLS